MHPETIPVCVDAGGGTVAQELASTDAIAIPLVMLVVVARELTSTTAIVELGTGVVGTSVVLGKALGVRSSEAVEGLGVTSLAYPWARGPAVTASVSVITSMVVCVTTTTRSREVDPVPSVYVKVARFNSVRVTRLPWATVVFTVEFDGIVAVEFRGSVPLTVPVPFNAGM